MKANRPRFRLVKLLIVAAMIGVVLLGQSMTPASATSSPGDIYVCDISSPYDQLIAPGGNYPPTPQQYCGIKHLENDAYSLYATAHGYSLGDPRIIQIGEPDIAGIMYQLLTEYAYDASNDPDELAPDEADVEAWFQGLLTQQLTLSAKDALAEYNKWAAAPCSYLPPNTSVFSFNGSLDPACAGTTFSLAAGPSPPSYENFLEYGQYEANGELGLDSSNTLSPQYQPLVDEQVLESLGAWSDMLLGLGPVAMNKLFPGNPKLVQLARANNQSRLGRAKFKLDKAKKAIRAARNKLSKLREDYQDAFDDNDGQLEKPEDLPRQVTESDIMEANSALDEAEAAGFDVESEIADIGAASLGSAFEVGAIGLAILVQQAQVIAAQEQIPIDLKANLASAESESAYDMISDGSGGGALLAEEDFISTLSIANPTFGVSNVFNNPPTDGTQIEVDHATDSGHSVYNEVVPSVDISAWPLGPDGGVYGAPNEQVAIAHGEIWRTVSADEQSVGMHGWVPTGELHYFDWSGHPRLAILDGTKWLDMPSPGSVAGSGLDAGDGCASGDCQLVSTIEALGIGGKITPGYTLYSATNAPVDNPYIAYPTNGLIDNPQDVEHLRLTIKPDLGTQPLVNVLNQYGYGANTVNDGPPDGGLIAGQTVRFDDFETNPLGYDATYTWQIETPCAYNPAHPPQTIQGVPVCYGNPDYGAVRLPNDEQDLVVNGGEDSAFHGNPVYTTTGEAISYTWPAPGVYHVRLITTDANGATQQSDQNITVAGPNPWDRLSSSAGMAGASVFGPVENGTPISVTGCLSSPDLAYGNPEVSVDWGDGTKETQSAWSGGDSSLSFVFDPTGDCSSPWEFTATHTYNLTSNGAYVLQRPLTVTSTDGFGKSLTLNFAVNIQFDAPASITSPDSTTFTAGSFGYFTVQGAGAPTPSVGMTGSLPAGLGFDSQANGTAIISGDPSLSEEGQHSFTLTAQNVHNEVTQPFTLTIDAAPTVTSPDSTVFTAGQASTLDLSADGYPAPSISVQGNLPSGASVLSNLSGAYEISDTPSDGDAGTYPLTITATNSAGTSSQALNLVVGATPKITSADTAGFVTGGAPSSFAVTTTGYPAPALSCQSPCTLPTGLAFHDDGNGTAVIYGATSATASDQVQIKASNSSGSVTQTLTVNATAGGGPPVSFSGQSFSSSDEAAEFTAGSAGSVTVTTNPGVGLALGGSLPSGLTFSDNEAAGTATISGTPQSGTAGTNGVEITTTSGSPIGYAFLTVSVFGPPVFSSASSAGFTEGSEGTFQVTTAANPRAALTLQSGTLPSGLTFTDNGDGTGVISGSPTQSGTFHVTIGAENLLDIGSTVTSDLTVTVNDAPAFTSGASPSFGLGTPGTYLIQTSGYPAAALSKVGALPAGLTFTDNHDGTATISGTPTDVTSSTAYVSINASSAAGTSTQTLALNLGPVPTISSLNSASFASGQNGSFTIRTQGNPTPAITLEGPLPDGLTFVDNGDGTASISGTPTNPSGGSATVTLTATNAFGSSNQTFLVQVNAAPTFAGSPGGLNCSSADPSVTSEQFITTHLASWTLCATGYPIPTLSLSGTLPAGLTFTDNGNGSATISGAADIGTAAGSPYSLSLVISNPNGTTTEPLSLSLQEQVQSTTTPGDITFVAGVPDTFTFNAIGNPTPAFTVCQSVYCTQPPSWLHLTDNGNGSATLSGTPPTSAAGTSVGFTLQELNGVGNGGVMLPVFVDIPAVGFTSAAPPNASIGKPYTYTFGTTSPATFGLATGSALPNGLHLSTTGKITGIPTSVGPYTFAVTATAAGHTYTSPPLTLIVVAGKHSLEISQFRVLGPGGPGDWFAQIANRTSVPIGLTGWRLGTSTPDRSHSEEIPLGDGILQPGGTEVVAGPYFSLALKMTPTVTGPESLSSPSGFTLRAPDGSFVDSAGQHGAPAGLFAGTGVVVPTSKVYSKQVAYVRKMVKLQPMSLDTDNNATDFAYTSVLLPPQVQTKFGSSTVKSGGTTNLRFTVSNPDSLAISKVSLTDVLPSGLEIASPNGLKGGCEGKSVKLLKGNQVELSGATLKAHAKCTFSLKVVGLVPGVQANAATVSSANVGTGNTATSRLTVKPYKVDWISPKASFKSKPHTTVHVSVRIVAGSGRNLTTALATGISRACGVTLSVSGIETIPDLCMAYDSKTGEFNYGLPLPASPKGSLKLQVSTRYNDLLVAPTTTRSGTVT